MTTPDKEEMPTDRTATYSEGISGDGAAVLRDGQPVAISEVIDLLNAIDTRAQRERRRDEVNRKSSAHSPQQGLATTMTAEAEASRVHGNVAKSEGSDRSAAALICSPSFALRSPTSACNAYEPMREALQKVMVGGNHLGLIIGADHPPYTASHEEARAHYADAIWTYEAWCCWKTIMEARPALSTLPVNDRHHSGSDNERLREALPGSIRIPLHSLQADLDYLVGRVVADGSCAEAMTFSVRERLNQIEAACYVSLEIKDLRATDRQTSDDVRRLGKWQSIDTAPQPRDWLKYNEPFLLAKFYQPTDEDGKPNGEPERVWMAAVYLTASGWMLPTSSVASTHGDASFRVRDDATHWMPSPSQPASGDYQSDAGAPALSEKFNSPTRLYAKCPCCNYSASPHEHRAEYKHFDPHWLECDRCHWQTQTYPNFKHARWAWNYASAIELAVQKAEAAEFFPSRSGLGDELNISNNAERDAVSLKPDTSSQPASEAGKLSTDEVL